jgi:predicted metalloprotease with PDZ domain
MMLLIRAAALVTGLAGLVTTLPGEVPCCDLRYRVQVSPSRDEIRVDLTIHGFRGETLDLDLPSQRPLAGLRAHDPQVDGVSQTESGRVDGAPRWRFQRPPGGWDDPIRIEYRLSVTAERPLNAWSVGMGPNLLYAPAEAIFLLPDMPGRTARHAPIRVHWTVPRGWQTLTGWPDSSFHGTRTLLKTNVLAGEIERHSVAACGLSIEVGVNGEWAFDLSGITDDIAGLACGVRYWLGTPGSDRYTVTLAPGPFPVTSGNRNGPRSIGLVHEMPDGSPPTSRLVAHELVHLWQRFDAPMWFQEGVNDYVALRLARESGHIGPEEYRTQLAAVDAAYRMHPRRLEWSFADEERETPPFGPSDGFLAYRKGALVGLLLDRELRLRTGGRADVTRLWREMNREALWGHVRWTDDEITTKASELAEGDMTHFFDSFVRGTTDLPTADAMLVNLPPSPHPLSIRGVSSPTALLQAALGQLPAPSDPIGR